MAKENIAGQGLPAPDLNKKLSWDSLPADAAPPAAPRAEIPRMAEIQAEAAAQAARALPEKPKIPPVTEGDRARWKNMECNTPVKLKTPVMVRVARLRRVDGELVFDDVERTHGAFVMLNAKTGAVRVSIKDMKMPNNPNEDCPWIEIHPKDAEPDHDYKFPGQRTLHENLSAEGGLVLFGGNDAETLLPGGRRIQQKQTVNIGGEMLETVGPVGMGSR